MRLVGLTGGIATGKSTVARILVQLGARVIDADQVSRLVVDVGTEGLAEIVAHFGPEALDETGAMDRAAMRTRITEDPDARAALERITHPRIRMHIATELRRYAEEGAAAAFVEAALLVETGGHALYPELWVVTCTAETQLARLMARDDMTEALARKLISTQLPLAEKEAAATVVIRNDSTHEALIEAVEVQYRTIE